MTNSAPLPASDDEPQRPPSNRWRRRIGPGSIDRAGPSVVVLGVLLLALVVALSRAAPAGQPSLSPLPSASDPDTNSRDLYVTPLGSDAAEGTVSDPLRTLQAAADRVEPGMTVWIEPGTYEGFHVRRSGATGRPITFAAARDADGAVIVSARSGANTIDLHASHDVSLIGLEITGAQGQYHAGVMMERASGIRISASTIHHNQSFGIEVRFSDNVIISGNDISHNAVGIRLYGEGDSSSVHDVMIINNHIHDADAMVVNDDAPDNDFGANAIIWHKVDGLTIARGNQVWANRAASHDYGTDGGAFEIWGSSNMRIEENTAWDNENVLESGTDGESCANISFLRNTAFGNGWGLLLRCASDSLIAHNTLDRLQDYAFELTDHQAGNRFAGSIANLQIVNNIVNGSRLYAIRTPLPEVVLDYNLVWNPGNAIIETPEDGDAFDLSHFSQRTGYELHGLVSDPLFVDPDAHDYHLLATSQAVDSGLALAGEAFVGGAPDRGRYETSPQSQ